MTTPRAPGLAGLIFPGDGGTHGTEGPPSPGAWKEHCHLGVADGALGRRPGWRRPESVHFTGRVQGKEARAPRSSLPTHGVAAQNWPPSAAAERGPALAVARGGGGRLDLGASASEIQA